MIYPTTTSIKFKKTLIEKKISFWHKACFACGIPYHVNLTFTDRVPNNIKISERRMHRNEL